MDIEGIRENRYSSLEGADGQIENACWLSRADANSRRSIAMREEYLSKGAAETVTGNDRLDVQNQDGCIMIHDCFSTVCSATG